MVEEAADMRLQAFAPALAALLAGCAGTSPLSDQPASIATIKDYYRAHAWEDGARCPSPKMQVTQAEIVERDGDREIIRVRYYWSDSLHGDTCTGFDTRTFTLAGDRVTEMSGEQPS